MINLLDINEDIEESCKKHVDFISCFIVSRLSGIRSFECDKFKTKYSAKENWKSESLKPFLIHYILTNLNKILSSKPKELELINNDFTNKLDLEIRKIIKIKHDESEEKLKSDLMNDLSSIVDYKKYFLKLNPEDDYSAYHLAHNLRVRSCTYCNRVYTVTHNLKNGEKLMRPQFDHWFPKTKYPLLALSFYNLIPSCVHCNSSVKGAKVLPIQDNVHPYIKEPATDDFSFTYVFDKTTDRYSIKILNTDVGQKHKNTLNYLRINDMYEAHQYELKDLLKTKEAYSAKYLEKLENSFPGAKLTKNEIYRLAFGTELNKKDFHKRPMSKFKYDILKELGIISD